MDKLFSLRQLLWIDGAAALLVSSAILAFSSRLSVFFNMPERLLQTLAVAGLLFAACSLNLARRSAYPKKRVYVLAVANAVYAVLAFCVAIFFFSTATVYGVVYFFAEAVFIGLLAFLEWRKIK